MESPIDNLFADDNHADDKPAEESLSIDEAPALESPIDNLFADDDPAAKNLDEELPAADAGSIETPAAEPEQPTITQDSALSVDSAFNSIFGDDDDLPEEKPAQAAPVETPVNTLEESVSLEEQVNQAEAELEMPETKSEKSSDLAQEMGGAFASMFGNTDDDLDIPEVTSQQHTETDSQESTDQELTGAPIEENFDKSTDETLSKDIDKSFDNLFGGNDDLDVPAEKSAQAESVAPAKDAAPEIPTVETAQDLDSLESEVSGAFKGLFDMDDDSLTEETKPSNKGVDFLMSGDSDDEISAGLINDPDAPLDRGAQDLDDSLNTRTLAEIYFDQGLYGKALEIYKDLAQKEPENEDIAVRLSEVEKLYNEKFGGNA